MQDNFKFNKNFYETAKYLPENDRVKFYDLIMEYVFNGTEPETNGAAMALFTALKTQIDKNKTQRKPKTSKTPKEPEIESEPELESESELEFESEIEPEPEKTENITRQNSEYDSNSNNSNSSEEKTRLIGKLTKLLMDRINSS